MSDRSPEAVVRKIVERCADCDICRHLMDDVCHFFPRLFRLFDREAQTGQPADSATLRDLVVWCNYCALCPCPNVRADIIRAKTGFMERDGIPWHVHAFERPEFLGKWCGTAPGLTNRLLQHGLAGRLIKKLLHIHPSRCLPLLPSRRFRTYLRSRRLRQPDARREYRKVVYFSGCTGRYLFPEIPIAAMEVLRASGITAVYPEQDCCGMPAMLEGDRRLTLRRVAYNLDRLTEFIREGFRIVCSCPTCGYFLKTVIGETAYYSGVYQAEIGGDERYLKVPVRAATSGADSERFKYLERSIYGQLLKDDGYFSSLDPNRRIAVAENTIDLGEFLRSLHAAGELNTDFGSLPERLAYFVPCHVREQKIGTPYHDIFELIPGLQTNVVVGGLHCCGMGGNMGYKKYFHRSATQLGEALVAKIQDCTPQLVATDCLSCRLQFQHLGAAEVIHPIEILLKAYRCA